MDGGEKNHQEMFWRYIKKQKCSITCYKGNLDFTTPKERLIPCWKGGSGKSLENMMLKMIHLCTVKKKNISDDKGKKVSIIEEGKQL
jgi:hypothetical protein